MQIPQTDYNAAPAVAIEGQLGDSATVQDIVSKYLAAADTPVAPGRLLVRSTTVAAAADQSARLPASAGDVTNHTQGISLYDVTKPPGRYGATLVNGQRVPAPMPCLRKGRVWVIPEAAVTQDGAVYARITVHGGLDQLGAFRGDGDNVAGTDTATLVPGARWCSSSAGGVPTLVEINLP